jgi:hypothetical protein
MNIETDSLLKLTSLAKQDAIEKRVSSIGEFKERLALRKQNLSAVNSEKIIVPLSQWDSLTSKLDSPDAPTTLMQEVIDLSLERENFTVTLSIAAMN